MQNWALPPSPVSVWLWNGAITEARECDRASQGSEQWHRGCYHLCLGIPWESSAPPANAQPSFFCKCLLLLLWPDHPGSRIDTISSKVELCWFKAKCCSHFTMYEKGTLPYRSHHFVCEVKTLRSNLFYWQMWCGTQCISRSYFWKQPSEQTKKNFWKRWINEKLFFSLL